MRNIIKALLIFLFLIGCANSIKKDDFGGGYNIIQKYNTASASEHHDKTDTGEKIKAGRRQQDVLNQAGRLRLFLFLYCRAYESKDLDKFSSFFAPDATENNRPFHELLPEYRKNMEMVESFNYRIELVDYCSQKDTGCIEVKGKFFSPRIFTNSHKNFPYSSKFF